MFCWATTASGTNALGELVWVNTTVAAATEGGSQANTKVLGCCQTRLNASVESRWLVQNPGGGGLPGPYRSVPCRSED